MPPTRVCIAYTAGGGGHRSVANALSQHTEATYGWQTTLFNPYRDGGAFFDIFKFLTGKHGEDLYNQMLKHFIPTYVPHQMFHFYRAILLLNKMYYRRRALSQLAAYWTRTEPNLVVSVMPWINDVFAESLRIARPGVPFVTVMTDYDECARDMWVSSPLQNLICSSERAAQRAAGCGHPPERIFTVHGVIISPVFHERPAEDRDELRRRIGLVPDVPAGLVMYGSQGASRMIKVARAMNRADYPLQLIFICGHDAQTAEAIRATQTRYPKIVLDFVTDMHRYMSATDFFVGKPGPSSIAESIARGLPMILDFDWRTMLQDRYTAMWAADEGVALLSRSMRELPERIRILLDNYAHYKHNVLAANKGNALLEVSALLERFVSAAVVPSA